MQIPHHELHDVVEDGNKKIELVVKLPDVLEQQRKEQERRHNKEAAEEWLRRGLAAAAGGNLE
eukprot:gene14063-14182_t